MIYSKGCEINMMWLEEDEAKKKSSLPKSINTQQQMMTTNKSQIKPTSFPLGCIILYYNNACSHNSSPKSKRRNAVTFLFAAQDHGWDFQ
jgi:hypothetical protein